MIIAIRHVLHYLSTVLWSYMASAYRYPLVFISHFLFEISLNIILSLLPIFHRYFKKNHTCRERFFKNKFVIFDQCFKIWGLWVTFVILIRNSKYRPIMGLWWQSIIWRGPLSEWIKRVVLKVLHMPIVYSTFEYGRPLPHNSIIWS